MFELFIEFFPSLYCWHNLVIKTKFWVGLHSNLFCWSYEIYCSYKSIYKVWVSFIKFIFIIGQVKDYRNILKLRCSPTAFTSFKAFLKDKKKCGTCLPVSFSVWFLKKNTSLVIFYVYSNYLWRHNVWI